MGESPLNYFFISEWKSMRAFLYNHLYHNNIQETCFTTHSRTKQSLEVPLPFFRGVPAFIRQRLQLIAAQLMLLLRKAFS